MAGFFSNLLAPFGTGAQEKAAADQQAALRAGQGAATGDVNTGLQNLQGSYAAGLAPLTQTYNQINPGLTQLTNLLGFGPQGGAGMQQTLQGLPGYQFALDTGLNSVQRKNAAMGYGGGGDSGNLDTALMNYGQGLANQQYGTYAQQLAPFLGATQTGANAIAGLNQGLGNQQFAAGNTLANIDYGTNVGIGNAQANADLAPLTAGGNIWGALGGAGKLLSQGAGSAGGSVGGNLASSLFSLFA